MKSLNNLGIASHLGMSVLCVNLLVSLTPSAAALPTLSSASYSPSGLSLSLAPESQPWTPLQLVPAEKGRCDESCPTLLLDSQEMLSGGGQTDVPTPHVIISSGAIEADVATFRALLGNPNNNATPGQQLTGHREINWDAVPAAVTNVTNFPVDFFNVNSKRGLVYDPSSLEVSDSSFVNINPDYAGEFIPFSGHKLFSPIGTNEAKIRFFVAGSDVKAAVRGFGAVFLDVDSVGSTFIELADPNGRNLGLFRVPVRSDRRGASFVGVVFRNPVIARVHIVAGDAALAAGESDITHGGQHDLVVMDDFLYGEPTATGI